jgi:hypothetical protein
MADLNSMESRLCSVVYTDIVSSTAASAQQLAKWRTRLSRYLTDAIRDVPESDRFIKGTGDGVFICFFGAPEAAMSAAQELQQSFMRDEREQQHGLRVRIGINLGTVMLVKDFNGAPDAIGDAINAGQRIMSEAGENRILVSHSFFEPVSRLSDDYKARFKLKGIVKDKNGREFIVYDLFPPGWDKAKIPDQTGEELVRDLGAVREAGKTTGPTSAPPQKTVQPHESEVTLRDTRPQIVMPAQTAAAPQRTVAGSIGPRSKRSKTRYGYVLLGAAVVIIAIGGWYFLRNIDKGPAKEQPAATAVSAGPPASATVSSSTPPVASEPAAAAVSAGPPASATESSGTPPVAPGPAAAAVSAGPPASATESSSTPPVASEPAAANVDFDPRSLGPKENAKLSIDAEKMPAGWDFTVEMNGKIYFQRSAEGNKTKYENLYVPPGVQEFHVTARKASLQRGSNTVRTEFKAKKRKILKIELRSQGQGANPQIVLTLK